MGKADAPFDRYANPKIRSDSRDGFVALVLRRVIILILLLGWLILFSQLPTKMIAGAWASFSLFV